MKLIMENWKKYLEEQEGQPAKGQYQSKIERFSITERGAGDRSAITVQLVQVRGDRSVVQRGEQVKNKSETKNYRSNNKDIAYQIINAETPSIEKLSAIPYEMELVIKKVENGEVVDKKVYKHKGPVLSPEMQAKYDEAKKGLINLGGD